jgi:hypothetical protein
VYLYGLWTMRWIGRSTFDFWGFFMVGSTGDRVVLHSSWLSACLCICLPIIAGYFPAL